jgi:hypothetical protein
MPYRVLNVGVPGTKPVKEYGKAHEEIQAKDLTLCKLGKLGPYRVNRLMM